MAITFIQQPYLVSPTGNPINFVASGAAHLTNFRYKVEVLDTPTSAVLYSEFKSPYPTNGTAWIDVGRILEPFTNYDISSLINHVVGWTTANVYRQYNVRFTEFFGVPSASGDTDTTNDFYAYNGAIDVRQWEQNEYQSYIIPNSGQGRFLTDREHINIRMNETYEVGIIAGIGIGTTNADNLFVEFFNSAGSTVATGSIPNTDTAAPTALFKKILVGTANIPLPTDPWTSYRISIRNGSNDRVSNYIYFYLDISCLRDDTKTARVHYLNKYGRFDSFTFKRPYTQSVSVEAKEYSRIRGRMTNSGYVYDQSEAGQVQYNTKINEVYRFVADWITDEESEALYQLAQSPAIFWEVEEEVLIPLILNSREFENRYKSKDKLFNAEMEFRIAYNQHRPQL
jgi:hypothetical protein